MERRDFESDAEYYRAHRKAFELALELGCTPKKAEEIIAQRERQARCEAAEARLRARMNAPVSTARSPRWGAPWMMQD